VAVVAAFLVYRIWHERQHQRELFEYKLLAEGKPELLRDCLELRYSWSETEAQEQWYEATSERMWQRQ
jgi:hypothetical protein